MGKKKFIDKNNSQKFHLLHRSMQDGAHAQEGVPSEFVLVPADQIVDTRIRSGGSGTVSEAFKSQNKRDHVDEFGFYNDGYDYAQHLREMGGGRFYGKDGHFHEIEAPKTVILPDDVLPSTSELRRDYEAITISHEVMDEDLEAALFDDADEDGEFEALDDDFVLQVMQEPELPDFDFDAHIAALIAKSEQCSGTNKPRGWDDAESKALKKIRNKKSIRFEDIGADGELLEESDEEDDEEDDDEDHDEDDESGEFDSDLGDFEDQSKGQSDFQAQRRAVLDAQLEETLEEYDDALIGDLEEVMGSDVEGGIDFDDLENNDAFNQVLDEYLQSEKDKILAEGVHVKKGSRNVLLLKKTNNDEFVHEELHPVPQGPVDFKKSSDEQSKMQEEWAAQVEELEQNSKEIEKGLDTCQEYLRVVKIEEDWDCATIISTYSTLDNHPTVIRDPKTKFKPYKSKFVREQEQQAALQYNDTASIASKASTKSKSQVPPVPQAPLSGKIILSGKMNLPLGFGPTGRNATPRSIKQNHQLSSISENTVNDADSDNDESDTGIQSDDDASQNSEEEQEDNNNSEEKEKGEGWVEKEKKLKARKKETPEEKKARKQATKEERKTKRLGKKQLKNMFKQEGSKIIHNVAGEQSINHVSVFKYSS